MKNYDYCGGNQQNCDISDCPKFGSIRVFADGIGRVSKCGDRPRLSSRKSRLNPQSKKTKEQQSERKKVRDFVLQRDHMQCNAKFLVPYIECFGPLDVDEIIPRGRGGNYLDALNCQVLCRSHHRWKHDNPAEAERLGLTKSLPPQ